MPPRDFSVRIDAREHVAAKRNLPALLSRVLNRETSATLGEFARGFSSARLGGPPGIKVKTRSRSVRSQKGRGPRLPKAMRLLGFKGELLGAARLEGKRGAIRTGNPQALAHELGATITPRRRQWLRIPLSKPSRAGRVAGDERKAFVFRGHPGATPLLALPPLSPGGPIRVIASLHRSIRIRARLGFLASWDAYEPTAAKRIEAARARVYALFGERAPQEGNS